MVVEECQHCKEKVNPAKTIHKFRHKGKIYCFCCKGCKDEFQKKKLGQIVY